MHVRKDRLRRAAAAFGFMVTVWTYPGSSAVAADASASGWSGDDRSAIRLLAGSRGSKGFRRAGVEIRLSPGWHTYWRYPGDAGVPPQFDFSHSMNIASVQVLWPAPERIPEQGLFVIGYRRDVILPLLIAPANADKPIKLHLQLDYAVCDKLCVPAQGLAELELGNGRSEWDAALVTAEGLVPKKRALGQGQPIEIQSVRRDRSQVIVDVAAPANARLDLFVEGPNAQWALPLPKQIGTPSPGVQRFAFDLEGAPPGTRYEGAVITLTVAGEHPIEVSAPLH
jgi:DsbC/DsbD-like thiol-disulfide interchange protein